MKWHWNIAAILVTLAVSAAITNGKISGMERLDEPKIKECLLSKPCIVTMDLTPLCGSDGRSYPNQGTIDCLNKCLKPEEGQYLLIRLLSEFFMISFYRSDSYDSRILQKGYSLNKTTITSSFNNIY